MIPGVSGETRGAANAVQNFVVTIL
jgi:hypothetical protein